MPHRLLSLLAILALCGCNQPFWTPRAAPEPAPPVAPASSDSIAAIVLTRTPCLGTCPYYELTLKRDGSAQYVGASNAFRQGTFVGRWTPGGFAELAHALLLNGFFTHDRLPGALDVPVTRICVTTDGNVPPHTIVAGQFTDYHYLWRLAAQLDSVAGGIEWRLLSDRADMHPRGCAG